MLFDEKILQIMFSPIPSQVSHPVSQLTNKTPTSKSPPMYSIAGFLMIPLQGLWKPKKCPGSIKWETEFFGNAWVCGAIGGDPGVSSLLQGTEGRRWEQPSNTHMKGNYKLSSALQPSLELPPPHPPTPPSQQTTTIPPLA